MAPTRRPGSQPGISIETASAYEMLCSIATILDEAETDTFEVGPEWIAEMRTRAGDELLERIRRVSHGDSGDTFLHLVGVAYDAPAPRDIPAFLKHLESMDPDEIRLHLVQFYARDIRRHTAPEVIRAAIDGDEAAKLEFLRTSHPDWEQWTEYLRGILDVDPASFKDELVAVLTEWADRVFKPEALTIMPILERDADAKRELLRELPADEFVTVATNGVEYAPRPGCDRVVMVPSFVLRPTVSHLEVGDMLVILYPVADESISAEVDTPPQRLVRLSKALGDEKRLRILRLLADGEKTLMELADAFGVAKTTMHHHMIVLRSAGLVSVGVGDKRYRLRPETVPDVGALLSGYLGAATGPSAASRPPAPARRKRTSAAG